MATGVLRPRASSGSGRGAAGEETPARRIATPRAAPVETIPGELRPVDEFLHTLARAIRQFHTYPATSPHCVEAVEESRRVLHRLVSESLVCVVRPRELLIDGRAIGRDSPVEHELARRLYESRCATIVIDRSATARELARLCVELATRRDRRDSPSLLERLRKHGVERITISSTCEPVLFDIEATAQIGTVIEQERQQQPFDPAEGRVANLYPADKG